jgi:hypothetical protein
MFEMQSTTHTNWLVSIALVQHLHVIYDFFEIQSTTHTLIEAGANAAAAPMRERQIVADFICSGFEGKK